MNDLKRLIRQLKASDWKVWEEKGWIHGGMVDQSFHKERIKRFLKKKKIRYGSLSNKVYDALENDNFHTLNKSLVDLGAF